MDFSFGEDADMVRQTAHEFVRRDLLPQEPKFLNAKDPAERTAIVEAATGSLKEMGLYSAGVPEAFGGGGLGPIETCLIADELGQTIIPVEWGELTPILYECSDTQKPKYLAPVVEGAKTYSVAFDEPVPFSEPAKMATTATQSDSGYVLNGAKLLAKPKADFYLVFAIGPIGPICLILDPGTPGTTLTGNLLTLRDCAVTAEQVLGPPGKALSLGRKWFPLTRIIRAAAILGTCDRLLEVSAQYAHDWTSMGTHISERASIQQTLADMAGDIEALRWMVYHTAWLAAEGKKVEYDSMLVKLQSQRVLTETVNRSVRIHGGTIPPIAEWLRKNAADSDATDLLRLAVARETISRLQP
ncbi:acyl-CoA dehydrogenase [candidate division WOR-3 bacterium]|uniref:Acyl-CoA dehydrogenase n=1 Tax=candidate division WOR-3 bacterium TaxID=2052148 RepID=A0A937XFV1_UNCW3|nr:acyl-CoA dehydrogenase [candidate division WOR-3 bacterium]